MPITSGRQHDSEQEDNNTSGTSGRQQKLNSLHNKSGMNFYDGSVVDRNVKFVLTGDCEDVEDKNITIGRQQVVQTTKLADKHEHPYSSTAVQPPRTHAAQEKALNESLFENILKQRLQFRPTIPYCQLNMWQFGKLQWEV